MSLLLRVVVSGDAGSLWTAQALECDVMAAGQTPEAAVDTLMKIIEVQVAHDGRFARTPLAGFAAAPQSCWDQFAGAAKTDDPVEVMRAGHSGELRYLVAIERAPDLN